MKTLCEWSTNEIAKELDALAALVRSPRFVCLKCARAARKKAALCKPRKLPADPSD